jgi:flagellar basal-body rod protein FlgB
MSSNLFESVDRLETAMSFHRERHTVLAGNVANVDTPGYRPMDLEPVEAPEGAAAMAVTNASHLQPAGMTAGKLTFDDGGQNAGSDGNAVSLEREMAKIDANRVRYAASAELASRRLALLRDAAGDGSGG